MHPKGEMISAHHELEPIASFLGPCHHLTILSMDLCHCSAHITQPGDYRKQDLFLVGCFTFILVKSVVMKVVGKWLDITGDGILKRAYL